MPTKQIEGDLLESTAQYIVHQTNCVSSGASGIAKTIFDKWPETNIYKERSDNNYWHKPGYIFIKRHVINAMGQFLPGPPGRYSMNSIKFNETPDMRQLWFICCLTSISCINGLKSVAFPYKIGCGLAGGDWDWYLKAIDDFADKSGVKTYIVKRPQDD
jgi:O-acetyl-ADP-ribose deacetylase (regulator of RNase III)